MLSIKVSGVILRRHNYNWGQNDCNRSVTTNANPLRLRNTHTLCVNTTLQYKAPLRNFCQCSQWLNKPSTLVSYYCSSKWLNKSPFTQEQSGTKVQSHITLCCRSYHTNCKLKQTYTLIKLSVATARHSRGITPIDLGDVITFHALNLAHSQVSSERDLKQNISDFAIR